MPTIPTTSLVLDLPLRGNQVAQLRAAIIEAAGRDQEWLHNHAESGEPVYRFPLVQYRVRHGRAAVWAVGEGTDALRQWLFQSNGQIKLGGRNIPFRVTEWKDERFEMTLLPPERPRWYYLNRWLPLNGDKYREWLQAPDLASRVAMLDNILIAHLLTFARGMDWRLPDRLDARLQQIVHTRKAVYHGVTFVSFDVVFTANLALPPGLGIGHAASHGYGITTPVGAYDKPEAFWEKKRSRIEAGELLE